MFSAFKKLTSKQEPQNGPPNSAGIPMSGSLQKKFAKGVQYNSEYWFEALHEIRITDGLLLHFRFIQKWK